MNNQLKWVGADYSENDIRAGYDVVDMWETMPSPSVKAVLTIYMNAGGFAGVMDFYEVEDGLTSNHITSSENPANYPQCWKLLPVEYWHPLVPAGRKQQRGCKYQEDLFNQVEQRVAEYVHERLEEQCEDFDTTLHLLEAYAGDMQRMKTLTRESIERVAS